MVEDLLVGLIAVQFGTLLFIAWRRHHRSRQPGALELAQVLAAYVFVALAAAVASAETEALRIVADAALSGGLAAVPFLMLRFASAFHPLSPATERALRRGTAVLVLAALPVGIDGLLPEVSSLAVSGVLVAAWVAAHVVAGYRLWMGGRGIGSAIVRRRSSLMAAGLVGLATVMIVAAATGALTGGGVTVTMLWTLVVTTVFLVGFAPPAWLQWQWSRRDRHSLAEAELELVRSDDPQHLVGQLLPYAGRLLGADVAWLTADGALIASTGPVPPGARATEVSLDRPQGVAETRQLARDTWVVDVWTGRGWFGALVGPYALLFGAGELDDVRLLAVHLEVALDRARLRTRELESVRRLEHANRVQEVDAIREDIIASVSHEMRTPLTTVCGATELLLARWDELEDVRRRDFVARVQANATQLRRVVQSLLDLTELRIGSVSAAPRWLAVDALIAETTQALSVALTRHEVAVDVDRDLGLHGDPAAIARVLEHLLINAAKFSPPASTIFIDARQDGDRVLIGVSDEGPGVERHELDGLVQPFTRRGHVLTRETRGLGVGLAVVAGLLEREGGELDVTTPAWGRGSRFEVSLPARNGEAASADASVGGSASGAA